MSNTSNTSNTGKKQVHIGKCTRGKKSKLDLKISGISGSDIEWKMSGMCGIWRKVWYQSHYACRFHLVSDYFHTRQCIKTGEILEITWPQCDHPLHALIVSLNSDGMIFRVLW